MPPTMHTPTECTKVPGTAQYSTHNWSREYRCPTCLRAGRFNSNFLSSHGKVFCDGVKSTVQRKPTHGSQTEG